MAKYCHGNAVAEVFLRTSSLGCMTFKKYIGIFWLSCLFSDAVHCAESIQVATASNFAATLRLLTDDFQRSHDQLVNISIGSTGKLYAQLINGAPYDIYLAADANRPQKLEQAGIGAGRFTYAIGQLAVLHSGLAKDTFSISMLSATDVKHIAIANPVIAPYGAAAKYWLESQQLWSKLQHKIIRGENVGQALQFVQSGHAQMGFVSVANLVSLNIRDYSVLNPNSYPILEQQAVRLNDQLNTIEFMQYLQSNEAKQIIFASGYTLP